MLQDDYRGGLSEASWERLPRLLRRFLTYVRHETTSDPHSKTAPSSPRELDFATLLAVELREAGAEAVRLLPGGVVMGELPATPGCEAMLPVGFVAHMDTSPEAPGRDVRWRLIDPYDGGDVVLNAEKGIVLSPGRFPQIRRAAGQPLVVTDGTTLLGADDKAGIAVIMEACRHVYEHPDIPHAKLCFAFTPDEEIGRGTENFRLEDFGAAYAYTVDGGVAGELDTETFHAARATVSFEGLSVHTGEARGRLVNAARLACEFLSALPQNETPETTEGREGFFHPKEISGTVAKARLELIVRDHDRGLFEKRIQCLRELTESFNARPGAKAAIEVVEQYRNMGEYLARAPRVVGLAREACRRCGLEVTEVAVRGGTDGSVLSEMGLPTPNLFTGGMNYHGVYECLSVTEFEQALDVVLELVRLSSEVKTLL